MKLSHPVLNLFSSALGNIIILPLLLPLKDYDLLYPRMKCAGIFRTIFPFLRYKQPGGEGISTLPGGLDHSRRLLLDPVPQSLKPQKSKLPPRQRVPADKPLSFKQVIISISLHLDIKPGTQIYLASSCMCSFVQIMSRADH